MFKMLKRFERSDATLEDIDLLLDVANNIEGNTICALGDAAAWPVQSMIKRFRDEFEKRCVKTNGAARERPALDKVHALR
jgi:NADH-quinone oxidoreductase subunit F